MKITNVKVHVCLDPGRWGLLAVLSFCLEGEIGTLIVHDVRIIQKEDGSFFLTMPNRPIQRRCTQEECNRKCDAKASFCPWCGSFLVEAFPQEMIPKQISFRGWNLDTLHPADSETRQKIQDILVRAYQEALEGKQVNPSTEPIHDQPR